MTSHTNGAFENDDVMIQVETSMMSQPTTAPPGSVTATNSNLAVTAAAAATDT